MRTPGAGDIADGRRRSNGDLPRIGRDHRPDTARSLREHMRPTRVRVALVITIAVLLLAAAGGLAFFLLHGHGARQAAGEPDSLRLAAASRRVAAPACPTEHFDRTVRGADAGGMDSGPDAIMWFQHSYYVERSAERAWAVVAPAALVPAAAVIQRGIDSIPRGTTYCVRVVTESEHTYSVEVTERRPGGAPATYDRQTVTTAERAGRTLITSIVAR
jgi:hypothetical protein